MSLAERHILIDGFLYKEESELHDFLAQQLNNGNDYGQNLTALWAILTDTERPCKITWKNFRTSQRRWAESANVFANTFREIEAYDVRIKRMRRITFEIID